jgi:hypothetical protein
MEINKDTSAYSYFVIGGYDSLRLINWMDINTHKQWRVDMGNMKINDDVSITKATSMLFDSTNRYNMIPASDFHSILPIITQRKRVCNRDVGSGVYYCQCTGEDDEYLPTVKVFVGHTYEFKITPS